MPKQLTINTERHFQVNGLQIEWVKFYDASGVKLEWHAYDLSAGLGSSYDKTKLKTWTIPGFDKARRAREIDFARGDVFTIGTEKARYKFDHNRGVLFVPIAAFPSFEIFETSEKFGTDEIRVYQAARFPLAGQAVNGWAIPDDLRAEIVAECGEGNWDSDHWRWIKHRVAQHPTKGVVPGGVFDGNKPVEIVGRQIRTEHSKRRELFDALCAMLGAGHYEATKALKQLVDSPEARALLAKVVKARDFE